MHKPFQTMTGQKSRLVRFLYEVKMFFLALAYLAALGVVVVCVLGAMLLGLSAAMLYDLVKNWCSKYARSPA